MQEKFCKDCKYFQGYNEFAKCTHPFSKYEISNDITGNTVEKYRTCAEMRYEECTEARLFEPKDMKMFVDKDAKLVVLKERETSKEMLKFTLDEDMYKTLQNWSKKQDKAYLKEQKKNKESLGGNFNLLTNEGKNPYYGAIGGELTYKFTPTSLGTVCKVYHSGTKEELDLTDYDSW